MSHRIARLLILPLLLAPAAARAELPANWGPGGQHGAYDFGIDRSDQHEGKPSLVLSSVTSGKDANLHTNFKAEAYRGKRIRYSGWLKTKDVVASCALYLVIVGEPEKAGSLPPRVVDAHSQQKAALGTTPWTKFDLVVDVPASASVATIGFYVDGGGVAWLSQPDIEIVGKDVPTTPVFLPVAEKPQLDLGKL